MPLDAGLSGSVTHAVTAADTALAQGTGSVPVLATPYVVLLAEQAAVVAIDGHVPAEHTTVGYRVQLDHLAPVPVGDEVTAEAVLETIEGRRLTFRVSVRYRAGLVAAGRITRVVVEEDRFLARATGTAD
jgi:fluoroacetyl-CoA thioesterase